MSATLSTPSKADRKRYGVSGQPLNVERVFAKDMSHDSGAAGKSWIALVPGGKIVHLNTYNGNVGAKVDIQAALKDAPDEKTLNKKIKGYDEVAITDCPFAAQPEQNA